MKPIVLILTDNQILELTEDQVSDLKKQLMRRNQSLRARKRWDIYYSKNPHKKGHSNAHSNTLQ